MLKFLYTIFTDPLGLPIDPVWEFVILLIAGEIVHEIAYWVSPGGTFGSLIYWITIRKLRKRVVRQTKEIKSGKKKIKN